MWNSQPSGEWKACGLKSENTLHSLKFEEKEHHGGPGFLNVLGVSNGGVGCVLHGSVGFHITDGRVRGVLHSAIFFHVAHGGMAGILDTAIAFDIADRGMGSVFDGAVFFDVTLRGVVATLDGAVGFHIACGGVIARFNGLAANNGSKYRQKKKAVFHKENINHEMPRQPSPTDAGLHESRLVGFQQETFSQGWPTRGDQMHDEHDA